MLDSKRGARRLSSAVTTFLFAAISVILPISPAERAVAAAPTPFNCAPVFYQISDGYLYEFDPVTVTYTNINPSSEDISALNAGGYNPADDFIYSFAGSSLYRVGSNGEKELFHTFTGYSNTTAGDFIGDNLLMTGANSNFSIANLVTKTFTNFSVTGWGSADFTYFDGKIIGATGSSLQIYTFDVNDPASGTLVTKTFTGKIGSSSGYGSAYSDSTGNIFIYQNPGNNTTSVPGYLYRFTPDEIATANPSAELVREVLPSLITANDGMSCNTATNPFAEPIAIDDAFAFSLGEDFIANTPETSLTEGDSAGVDVVLNDVSFCGLTATNDETSPLNADPPSNHELVCQDPESPYDGTTLTILSWVDGYFSLSGLSSLTVFQYSVREAQTVYGQSEPRVSNQADVTVKALVINENASGPNGVTLADGLQYWDYVGHTFTASGSDEGIYFWQATGLPAGMSVDFDTGYLSGQPETAGDYNVVVSVGLDEQMKSTVSKTFTLHTDVAPTFDLNFDGNATNLQGTINASVNVSRTTVPAITQTKPGYTFAEWTTDSDGVQDSYQPGDTITIRANQTLFAQWNPNTYTITYRANTGTGTVPTAGSYIADGTAHTIKTKGSLSKAGYSFSHWNTQTGGGGTSYAPGDLYESFANLTLNAIWTPNTYTISYNANLGSGIAPADQQYTTDGAAVVLSSPTDLAREHYTFDEWNTQADGTGTGYEPGDSYSSISNLELFAIWSAVPYTLSFADTFEATGTAPDDIPFSIESSSFTVPGPGTLERTGYTFAGWNTQADGAGTEFQEGDTFNILSSVVLYATWDAVPFTLFYQSAGHDSGTAPLSQGFTIGNYPTVSDIGDLERLGYEFLEWNTQADGLGTSFQPGDSFSTLATVTLHAIWSIVEYELNYQSNGATSGSAPAADDFTVLSYPTISDQGALVRIGYEFTGWNTESDGSGDDVAPGATVSAPGNLTLYAMWDLVTYTLTYESTDHSEGTAPASITYDVENPPVIESQSDLGRFGYAFGGWIPQVDGPRLVLQPGDSFLLVGNIILSASWDPVPYTIQYNSAALDSGSVPAAQVFTIEDRPVSVSDGSGMERAGYSFESWNTSADGTGTRFEPNAIHSELSDLNLYAQWQLNTYTITFDANQSSLVMPASLSFTVLQLANLPLVSSVPGYEFLGWSSTTSGDSGLLLAGVVFETLANTTLYAQWRAIDVAQVPVAIEWPDLEPMQICQTSGSWVVLEGKRLEGVSVHGEGTYRVQGNELMMILPELSAGRADVTLEVGEHRIVFQNYISICPEPRAWTKRLSNEQAKLYFKHPIGVGKVQFFLNEKEVAWVRTDRLSPRLRVAGAASYLVRTVDLNPGRNVLEIYLDGKRERRVIYTRR